MTTDLLVVDNIHKSFGVRKAVDGVSFRVAKGETLGLIGPNGAGKSTTVSMICGLLKPDQGSITLEGRPTIAEKHRIGLVPQDLALFDELSAQENLRVIGALYGLRGELLQQRCQAALKLVTLEDRAQDKPSTFSGGMKRRLNIAAALLHEPQLLILDEPTVGVDPQSRNAIFESLEVLKAQGRSLIYTSHYMEEVERLADNVIIIDHGKVLADDSPEDLYKRLPAHAELLLDFASAPTASLRTALEQQAGVKQVAGDGAHLRIALREGSDGLPLLNWLDQQGQAPLHYATNKAKLEDIFLTLTGRSLRD